MFDLGALVGRMRLDTSDWNKGIAEGKQSASVMKTHIASISAEVTGLGIRMSVAGAAITGFFTKAMAQASQAKRAQNMLNIAFGESAKAMQPWIEETARAFRVEGDDIMNIVAKYNLFLQEMGATSDAARDMAKNMTVLANQMAIISGSDPESVFFGLEMALMGSSRALRQYGIAIKESDVQQYAWSHGIAEMGKSLTQTQMVLSRYGLLMEKTARLQAGSAAQMDGLSAHWREFRTNVSETLEVIGFSVTDTMKSILSYGSNLLRVFQDWYSANEEVASSLARIAFKAGALMTLMGTIILLGPQVTKIVSVLTASFMFLVTTSIRSFAIIGSAILGISAPIWVVIGLIALIGTSVYVLVKQIQQNWGGVGDIWKGVAETIRQSWNAAISYTKSFYDWFQKSTNQLGDSLEVFRKNIWRSAYNAYQEAKGLWTKGGGLPGASLTELRMREEEFEVFWAKYNNIAKNGVASLTILPQSITDWAKEIPSTFADNFKMLGGEISKDLDALLGWASTRLGAFVDKAGEILKAKFPKIANTIGALGGLASSMWGALWSSPSGIGSITLPKFDVDLSKAGTGDVSAEVQKAAMERIRDLKDEIKTLDIRNEYIREGAENEGEYNKMLRDIQGTDAQINEQRELALERLSIKQAALYRRWREESVSFNVETFGSLPDNMLRAHWAEYFSWRRQEIDQEIEKLRVEKGIDEEILAVKKAGMLAELKEKNRAPWAVGPNQFYDTYGTVAEGFSSSFSQAFQDVLNKTKTFSDAMKDILKSMGESIVKAAGDWIAKYVTTIVFGSTQSVLAERAGAVQRIGIHVWEWTVKAAQTVWGWAKIISTTALGVAKTIAIELAGAVKSVAIAIWKIAAQLFAACASLPYGIGVALAAALIAGVIGSITALRGSFKEGTDYVPSTGPYMLHEGEQVVPRYDAVRNRSQGSAQITIVNLVTSEAVASAMSSQAGRNVIMNTIVADVMQNGATRQVLMGA